MRKINFKKHVSAKTTIAVLVTAAIVAASGGVAYAYWTGLGSGTGSATSATSVSNITVSQAASTGVLSPGVSVPLSGLLTNPNNTDIKVGSLTATITGVSNGANLADFSVTGGPVLVDAIVKKGTPLAWSGLTLNYANSAVNQDNGKGATVSLSYALTPFVENVLPPLGTFRVLVVNGVRTMDIYVHLVGATVIQPGDTLSTYDFNVVFGNPAWVDNLATADASGNIRYFVPIGSGHDYQITIKRGGSLLANFPTHLS